MVEEKLLSWQGEFDNYANPIDVLTKAEPPKQSDDLVYKVRECASCLG